MTKTNLNNNNQKDITTRKYIVEAPEPKKGQTVSSGGIREKGRLSSQFKNPIPYTEPTQTSSVTTQKTTMALVRKEQVKAKRFDTGKYLLSLTWQELGEPLLRSGLRTLGNVIINRLEDSVIQNAQHLCTSRPETIDVEANEIDTNYNDDKIIRFPSPKVI